jgi:hypothetical protein
LEIFLSGLLFFEVGIAPVGIVAQPALGQHKNDNNNEMLNDSINQLVFVQLRRKRASLFWLQNGG